MPHDASPDRWDRMQSLFFGALDLPAPERGAYLRRECGDDALRAEVEALLAVNGEASFLDHPPLHDKASPEPPSFGTVQPGMRLGAWCIVRYLGAGGMGEVYLAERAEGGFAQQAAIKRLRSDVHGHDQRFLAERDILAQLDHPHIARLLDGGIDEGRAWMAMEYVDGQDLRAWCNSRRPGLAARLSLFRQICSAVVHAHANLVIHRDLKPSNILVTEEGFVKLLDFGVAKLSDGQLNHHPTATAPFTPDHAAPEQLQGGPATIAIDVFALGVVLYELLCGSTPWSQGETPLSRAIDKLLREEPKLPSKVAEALPSPPVPAKLLRGDLDAIVMRCLRREPADRYPTVQALLEDLDRLAAGAPVLARRGGRLYKLRRWARRHRAVLAVASLGLIALLVAGGVATWQAIAKNREAIRAQEALRQSEAVRQFMESVFLQADPNHGNGAEATAIDLLSAARARIPTELGAEPAVAASLLAQIGNTYAFLGKRDLARETLKQALEFNARADNPSVIVEASAGGLLAYQQAQDGKSEAALVALNQIIDNLLEADEHDALSLEQLGKNLEYKALVLKKLHRTGEGLRARGDAIEAWRRVRQERPNEYLSAIIGYAADLAASPGRASDALVLAEQALQDPLLDSISAPPMLRVGALGARALALHSLGRYAEAEVIESELVVSVSAMSGRDSGQARYWRMRHVETLVALGRLDEAQARIDALIALPRTGAVASRVREELLGARIAVQRGAPGAQERMAKARARVCGPAGDDGLCGELR